MSGFHDNALIGASGQQGYQISRSVRLRSSASAYFNRTFASVGTRTKFTYSAWLKRGALGSFSRFLSDSTNNSYLRFDTSNALEWNFWTGTSYTIKTSQVFRDSSAWYHIIVAVDTTQATSSNRVKFYVNGTQVTSFSTASYPAQNDVCNFNNNTAHYISGYSGSAEFLDGYITEVNFIDGQALDPSYFGETNAVTGVWQPKKYAGTYGTNGFYLNFSDNSAATAAAIGADYSGNGNDWTPNNISVTAGVTYDSMLDVPTQWADGGNGRGNYATLNPLDFTTVGTISEANLRFAQSSSGSRSGRATIGVVSGKWYWEVTNLGGNNSIGIGNASMSLGGYCGQDANGWSYFIDGNKYNNNTATAYGASYTTNDVIGVALDMDAGTLTFYKNGVSQGQAFSSLSGTMFPAFSASSVSNVTFVANFGQRPFAYTPPTGFKALNTQNLPEPTILKGNQYFDVSLYSGNSSTQNITNSGAMQPDLVWSKSRSTAGTSHVLIDAVRGVNQALQSDLTNAEATFASSITAFNSDGFALGSSNQVNLSGRTYVGWQWKEGPTQGFDIVTYSGTSGSQNVSHNLGVAPKLILVKQRNGGAGWRVYSASLANTQALELNATSAAFTQNVWNNTTPTSSVFSVTDTAGTWTNGSGNTYVAYLFSEVAGFSKFGSYVGNGSADGPMIFTGFLPRWVLIKCSSAAGTGWYVYDTARNTYNVMGLYLRPEVSDAETTFTTLDCLSNGFKIRTSNSQFNGSGSTYIYAAFAEFPFRNALAR